MLKKTIWLMVALALPSLALAKDLPRGKWWHNSTLSSAIDLSESEKAQLDEKYIDNRRELIQLKSNLELERFELEVLLEKDPLDETAVMEQFKKMNQARQELATARFQFVLEVRKLLGADRFEQLKQQFKQKRHRKGGPKGSRPERGPQMEGQGPPVEPPPGE